MAVRIITLNCRGLRNSEKRRAIFHRYRKSCEILCLQETHSCKEDEEIWTNEWGGRVIYSHGETNARGVAILFKRNLDVDVSQIYSDPCGRKVSCNVLSEETSFSLVAIYAPNKESPGFFTDVIHNEDNLSVKKIVIGDFNLVLNPKLDSKPEQKMSATGIHVLQYLPLCKISRSNQFRYESPFI